MIAILYRKGDDAFAHSRMRVFMGPGFRRDEAAR